MRIQIKIYEDKPKKPIKQIAQGSFTKKKDAIDFMDKEIKEK
jgi:hypothetical protein